MLPRKMRGEATSEFEAASKWNTTSQDEESLQDMAASHHEAATHDDCMMMHNNIRLPYKMRLLSFVYMYKC